MVVLLLLAAPTEAAHTLIQSQSSSKHTMVQKLMKNLRNDLSKKGLSPNVQISESCSMQLSALPV